MALSEVTKLQVRAFFLEEAKRGIAPITRSNALFALRGFYRFLIAEDLSEVNPAAAVTLPSPNRPRVERPPELDSVGPRRRRYACRPLLFRPWGGACQRA